MKVIIPAIPRSWGEAVVTNDWYIITGLWEKKSYYFRFSK